MNRSALRSALPALLLAAAILVPFRDKAFTIDDTLFLRQAEHVLQDPLHPTAFEMVWSEFPVPLRMSSIMPSGPVGAYLLVPCLLAGGAEWAAHLVHLLLFGVGIVATARLALRLGLDPGGAGVAAALLAATPTALGMAGTCMPDAPAMALGALAVERSLAWRDERRIHQGLSAAVALALAVLARSHLLLLGGVIALLLPGEFPSVRGWLALPRRLWLPLVLAPILVVATMLLTRDPMAPATALLGAARKFSALEFLTRNVIAFAAHWTLVLPFGLPWIALHPARIAKRPVVYLFLLAAAVTLLVEGEGHRLPLIAAAAGIGLGSVWDALHDAWRRRDRVQLALAAWLFLATPVVLYLHLPSKYQLASAPAVAILVARALSERSLRVRRAGAVAIVVAGTLLGALILKADADFADLGRAATRELIAPEVAAGRTVWFAGHWGFQWYAEKAGARPITATPPLPHKGDLAVSSLRCFGEIITMFPDRQLIKSVIGANPGGRIMSYNLGTGFYGNAWGYLPWAWGDEVLDQYDLWRLE